MERIATTWVARIARFPLAVCWLAMLLGPGGASTADRFMLVSPEEFAQSQAAPQFEPKEVLLPEPGAPEIVVLSPVAQGKIRTPMDIRLTFVPAEGAAIDPDSLRILYGWLKLDITDRVMKHAKFSPSELSASGADIPAGNHKIVIRVSDDKGRTGERTIKFTAVEEVAGRDVGNPGSSAP